MPPGGLGAEPAAGRTGVHAGVEELGAGDRRGEGDFGDEHQHTAARTANRIGEPQIHLGLATDSDAVQQRDMKHPERMFGTTSADMLILFNLFIENDL